MAEHETAVRLVDVTKSYGDVVAVDGVSLDIRPDEFFTLLGPSGSGKTTCLKMIAGFEQPDAGRSSCAGADVTNVPPFERDVNTVFQDYALFPHLTVAQNVGYGLKVKKVARSEIRTRVKEALGLVPSSPATTSGARPQLSGGQRQRVALARSLVNRPARAAARRAARRARPEAAPADADTSCSDLQQEVGITFIYVTHDQEEALTMSDRIAVFRDGNVEQVGAPGDVYENPASEFVAGFVGTSNIVERDGERISIRPEKVRVLADGEPSDGLRVEEGLVRDAAYVGVVSRFMVELDQGGSFK